MSYSTAIMLPIATTGKVCHYPTVVTIDNLVAIGAAAMYEAGYRTGREVIVSNSNEIIEQFSSQRNYYAASLCCLKLCCHDYQWLVRPAGTDKGDHSQYYIQSKLLLYRSHGSDYI